MKTIRVNIIRDVRNIRFIFKGETLPEGLKAFGWATKTGNYSMYPGTVKNEQPAVVITGRNEDKMPCLAAADYCRDHGYDVEFCGFKL